ncbi:MAG TPA: GAF domain-containing SpoIIE family protein phosphatase [Solirubrobacterales bacterium]
MDGIIIVVLGALLVAALALLARMLIGAGRAMRRFSVLNQIAEVSDRGGSLRETLDEICEVLVPEVADFCMIDLISDGQIERIAVKAGPDGGEGATQGLAERRPSLPEPMERPGQGPVEPRFIERMTEAELRDLSHDEEDLEFLRSLETRSAVTVALRARGRLTGALTMGVGWSGRRFRSADADFARVLSGRIALTLDNAGLFSDLERAESARAEIAETLQHGLLPPPLPQIPGWSLAASYRPAGAENEVGGDFYDAFPAAGGWMLVVGDVTGRGARAAAITAQACYTLRTAAILTGDPLVALSTLNRALLARRDPALCSVAALAISEDPLRPVRLAVAGHPPPLVIDGETVSERNCEGPVLGAFADGSWELEQIVIEPGQQLVILTDGIAEACGQGGRFGDERVRSELCGAGSPVRVVQRLEGALQAFTGGVLEDDVAILALSPDAPEGRSTGEISIASAKPLAGTTGFGSSNG